MAEGNKLNLPDDFISHKPSGQSWTPKVEVAGYNDDPGRVAGLFDDSKADSDPAALENNIPLPPQWLYAKPSESKMDPRVPNLLSLGNATDEPLASLGRLIERVLASRPNVIEEHLNRSRVSEAQRDFHQLKPPTFSGGGASISAHHWLSAIEEAFRATAIYDDDLRLMTAPSLFREEAILWWKTEMKMHKLDQGNWTQFRERFLGRYFPKIMRYNLRREFERLYQGSNTVEKYRQDFNNLSRYALDLVATEGLACLRFEAGLNIEIRLGLAGSEFTTLGALADAAVKFEEILEEKKMRENRNTGGRFQSGKSNKGAMNNKVQGSMSGNKRSSSAAGFYSQKPSKSTKSDGGNSGFKGCYNCGKPGHLARDCTSATLCHVCKRKGHTAAECSHAFCYKCGMKGHIGSRCPSTPAGNAGAPAPSIVGSTYVPAAGRGREQATTRNSEQGQSRGPMSQIHAMETTSTPEGSNFLHGA